jgi:hydroxyacylglutathione hydrolase
MVREAAMAVRPSGVVPGIIPVVDEGLGNSSYLVDLGGGQALVVDPARDPTPYLALAERHRLRITAVAETHLHADFVSGGRELARDGTARVIAPRAAGLAFPHQGVEDGEGVEVGDGLELRALATPGHAPEHVAWLLGETGAPADRTLALFSGGALLVGSVARTDLTGDGQAEPLARAAYRSLRQLLTLPDALPVYPTHGAGSFCAAPSSDGRTTTIGAERRGNPLAAAGDEDAFVAGLLGGLGTFPPYFLRLREVNRRGAMLLEPGWRTLPKLPPERVHELVRRGAVLVDARPVRAFAAGHPAGAVSNALRPQFATWLGWLFEPQQELVVLLDEDQDRTEVARQARTIGYDRLLGEVAGGFAAWRAAGLPVTGIPTVTPEALAAEPSPGRLLDVRQDSEVASGHQPGAVAVQLGDLPAAIGRGQVQDGPLTVVCGHGERAATGASLLLRAGRDPREVQVLAPGGPAEWARAAGRPLATR